MKTFWKTFLIPSQQVFVVLNHCKNPINLRNVSKRAKRAKKRQRTKKRRKAKKQIGKTTSRDKTRRIIHVASGTVGPVGGGGVDELELNVLFLLLWAWSAGTQLLALWPVGSDKRSGHVPKAGRHRHGHQAALLSVELPERDARFPAVDAAASASASQPRRELASLDDRTQQTLLDAVRGGSFAVMDLYRREVRCLSLVWSPFQSLIVFFRSLFFRRSQLLWEKRHYLTEESGALARILLAAQSWDWASLADLYWLLEHWTPLSPLEALQLLLPWLPDVHVRRRAVDWLRPIGVDELLDYLPQLIEALKLETHDHSPLMLFLLERSLQAPQVGTRFVDRLDDERHSTHALFSLVGGVQVAHALYWLLNQQLPGASPQNSDFDDVAHSVDPRYSGYLHFPSNVKNDTSPNTRNSVKNATHSSVYHLASRFTFCPSSFSPFAYFDLVLPIFTSFLSFIS